MLPPGAAFSHLTAAALWCLPLPLGLERAATRDGQPLLTVAVPSGPVVPRRAGLQVWGRLDPSTLVRLRGLASVSAEAVWCDLAPRLGDVDAIGRATR